MDWEFIVDRIGLNHNEIVITDRVIDADVEWLISPNHNEIVRDDPFGDWVVSPNHNEIVIAA